MRFLNHLGKLLRADHPSYGRLIIPPWSDHGPQSDPDSCGQDTFSGFDNNRRASPLLTAFGTRELGDHPTSSITLISIFFHEAKNIKIGSGSSVPNDLSNCQCLQDKLQAQCLGSLKYYRICWQVSNLATWRCHREALRLDSGSIHLSTTNHSTTRSVFLLIKRAFHATIWWFYGHYHTSHDHDCCSWSGLADQIHCLSNKRRLIKI